MDENVQDVVVSRIKALDLDLEHSDNWRAVFTIARGNEDNVFVIETDENTNEGVLKLVKVRKRDSVPLPKEDLEKDSAADAWCVSNSLWTLRRSGTWSSPCWSGTWLLSPGERRRRWTWGCRLEKGILWRPHLALEGAAPVWEAGARKAASLGSQ